MSAISGIVIAVLAIAALAAFAAARKVKIPLKPPAGVAASRVARASATRGEPGWDLGHHPELDGREDGYCSGMKGPSPPPAAAVSL